MYRIAGLFYLILTAGSLDLKAQSYGCEARPELKIAASCEPLVFNNGARVYWSFNCDSAWLTFKSKRHPRRILSTLDSNFISFAGRLGYASIQEYKTSFLIQNNLVSGCCEPPEYHLFSKRSGKLIRKFDEVIYHGIRASVPFVVRNADTYYNRFEIYNVNTNCSHFVSVPKGLLTRLTTRSGTAYWQDLFDEPILRDDLLLLKFRENLKNVLPPKAPHVLRIILI